MEARQAHRGEPPFFTTNLGLLSATLVVGFHPLGEIGSAAKDTEGQSAISAPILPCGYRGF
jgi:hypothetical protein